MLKTEDERIRALLSVRQPPAPSHNIVKMSFEDWSKLHGEWLQAQKEGLQHDSGYVPFSVYGVNLIFYSDGRPRPRPLRALLVNEVGMIGEKFLILKDKMPGDKGGLEIQVPVQIEKGKVIL